MNAVNKMKAAAVSLSAAALILAGLTGWQYFTHRIPAVRATEPEAVETTDLSASADVEEKLEGFTVSGSGKTAAAANPGSQAGSESSGSQKYKLQYNMVIRKSPDYDGAKAGGKDKGDTITVTETKSGSNGSVWGKLSDGNWVCLSDNEYTYAEKVN